MFRNVDACEAIAATARTSFGPYGRNKIIVNHLQKVILTNDAATIMRELDVVHPAAKLLVMASQQQEAEVGDIPVYDFDLLEMECCPRRKRTEPSGALSDP